LHALNAAFRGIDVRSAADRHRRRSRRRRVALEAKQAEEVGRIDEDLDPNRRSLEAKAQAHVSATGVIAGT